jgi:hypothetical protein
MNEWTDDKTLFRLISGERYTAVTGDIMDLARRSVFRYVGLKASLQACSKAGVLLLNAQKYPV